MSQSCSSFTLVAFKKLRDNPWTEETDGIYTRNAGHANELSWVMFIRLVTKVDYRG